MFNETLIIEKIDETLPTPHYAHPGDAGLDCYSSIDITIEPLQRASVPLGIRVQIPEGKAALMIAKSGLAINNGLGNIAGLIDQGYRGEVNFICYNNDPDYAIEVKKGQKICQMMIVNVPDVDIKIGKVEKDTERGENGFGSTGLN